MAPAGAYWAKSATTDDTMKLGRFSAIHQPAQKIIRRRIVVPSAPVSFANPSLTIGSAVTTVAQSPFAGGGNSYSFISSVDSYIDTPASAEYCISKEFDTPLTS